MSRHQISLISPKQAAAILRKPLTVTAEMPVTAAISTMAHTSAQTGAANPSGIEDLVCSSCVIVIEDRRVIGLLTEQDVVQLCAQQQPLDQLTVGQVMTQPAMTLRQAELTDLKALKACWQQWGIRHLPVVDATDCLVGLVTQESLLQAAAGLDCLELAEDLDAGQQTLGQQAGTPLGQTTLGQRAKQTTVPRHQQDSFLQLVIDSSPLLVFVKDWEGRYLVVNPAMANFFNSTVADLIGKTDAELGISSDYTQRFVRENQQVIATQQAMFLPAERMVVGASQVYWFQWHKQPIQLPDQQGKGVLGIGVDITAQKQTEIALQHSEARWQFALEGAGDGVWDWDLQTNEVFFSPRWKTMLGYAEEDLGSTLDEWRNRVHPDDYEACCTDLDRYFKGETELYQNEHRVRCKDGSYKWILDRGKAVNFSPTGEPLRMIGTHSDITARKQVELSLSASERQLSTLIQNLPGYCYRVQNDSNYTPLFMSSGVTAITGYHPHEYLIERSISCGQEMHPDDVERVWQTVQQAVQDHKFYECEYRLISKNGEQKWVWERGQGIYNEKHELCYLEGFVTDITDRKQAEAELQRTDARLREAQRIAHLGNWEFNLRTDVLQWSEEIFRIFEIDPQRFEASYEGFLELVHPEDRERVYAAYQEHLHDRTPYNLIHRLTMPDGRVKYVHEQCESFFGEDGTPILSQGTVQDITGMKQAELERERAEETLRQVIVGTATTMGQDFFPALVRHIAEALGVRYASVSRATPEGFETLAFFSNGALSPAQLLPYCSVPCCVQALEMGECCHPDSIPVLYPDNLLFTQLQIESYLGVGLRNAAGEPSGNLCILHDQPLPNPDWAKTLLRIFAARAGAELDRYQTAQALEQLTAELEQRVEERTAQLQQREAQLEDLFDNANDLIQSVWLADGRFEYVNRAWRETLGYSEAEVAQLTLLDVLHPSYHVHCQTLIGQMQGGRICTLDRMELVFLTKDQRKIMVEGSLNCRVENDRPVATRAIFRDITDRKAAEQQLQEREARYRAVMDHASDAIVLANSQGCLVEVNRKAEELLGYTREELAQMTVQQIHPPEVLDAVRHHFSGILANNEGPCFETLVLRKDGTQVPVDITGSRLELNGEVLGQGIFRDISDRKRSENALRESQQFLQTVLDTFPLSVFWKDQNSVYLGCNHNFLQDAGSAAVTDLVGKTDYDMPWASTTAEAFRADDKQVIASGVAKLGIIEPLRRANGQCIWLETNKLPLRDLEGEVVGILGTYQDVTERKQAQIQLQAQEQFLRSIYDGVEYPIFVIEVLNHQEFAEFSYVDWNAAAEKAFGIASQAIVGKTPEDIYGPAAGALERQRLQTCVALGTALTYEEQLQYSNQPVTWWLTTLNPLKDDSGQVCRVVGTTFDISDRKQAEFQLQNITDRLTLALQAGSYGIWEWYIDGELTWDSQMYQIFGMKNPGRPITYQDWRGLVHPDDIREVESRVPVVIQGEQDFYSEFRILRPDGELRWVQSIARARRDAQGNPVAMVGINQDITERKLAEQQLTDQNQQLALYNQELARATRLKDEFLANMSHELRTPLNAILGMTEGLQEEIFGPINPAQTKALKTVEKSAAHLLTLINDILDVAKIESGQVVLERTAVSPQLLCSSSLAFIKQQALYKSIQVSTHLAPNLPDLWVDERRILQVLINLLTNAVKFTPHSGNVTLTVVQLPQSERSGQQPYLRIAIADTGIGIAADNIPKLFQPFVQIDSALNRQYTGTGLGLALVKQFVELHGGQVGVTSELGTGSCFFVELPCVQSATPCPGNAKLAPDADYRFPQPKQTISSPLILLAEDNQANLSTISSYLKAKGYRLRLAKNGKEVIAQVETEPPDLILMDIQMPEMDGLEAIERIRQIPHLDAVPIVALTALAMVADQERCLAAGANDYLSKPVKLKQLVQTIQRFFVHQEP